MFVGKLRSILAVDVSSVHFQFEDFHLICSSVCRRCLVTTARHDRLVHQPVQDVTSTAFVGFLHDFVCIAEETAQHKTEPKRDIFTWQTESEFVSYFSSFDSRGASGLAREIYLLHHLFGEEGINWRMDPTLSQRGFRFAPTDEELVGYFLTRKVADSNYVCEDIGEVDFNQVEPGDLRARAKEGKGIAMFFFSRWDKKYPIGVQTNRATKAGYWKATDKKCPAGVQTIRRTKAGHWKATGKDVRVLCRETGSLLGVKKSLVFYAGRAGKAEKTDWIMHEYRTGGQVREHEEEWVLCRISEKRSKPCRIIGPVLSNSTDHPPGLISLNSQIEKPNTLTEQERWRGSAIVAENGETSRLERSFSAMTGLMDLQLGDTLDDLISGWDMGSPVPIWDIRAGS